MTGGKALGARQRLSFYFINMLKQLEIILKNALRSFTQARAPAAGSPWRRSRREALAGKIFEGGGGSPEP